MNYYELLNISHTATVDEIKRAYRKMIQQYHPDHNKSPDAEKITIQLNHAKEILLNENKRKEYDAFLQEQERIKKESEKQAHYSHQQSNENNHKHSHNRSQDIRPQPVRFNHFYQYYFFWIKLSSKSFLLKFILSLIGLFVKLTSLMFRLTILLIYMIIYILEFVIDFYIGIMGLLGLVLLAALIYGGWDGAVKAFESSNVLVWGLKTWFYILFFSIPVIVYYGSMWLCEALLALSYKLEYILFKYIFQF